MKKSLKPPKSSGISPKFTISKRDCKINNMNNSLSNLVAKNWNNLPQLAKTSVKNASRPYYNVDIYKSILDFVAQVKTHYGHHINLVSFVTKLKDYLRLPEVKEDLMIQIDHSIKNANNDYLTAIAEKSSRKTRATSKALEKAMATKAAAAELFDEFTLNRKKSTESLSTVSISSDGIESDREEEDDPIATRTMVRRKVKYFRKVVKNYIKKTAANEN
ncbi:hypothetical protein G6F56_007696 [Rhizopus delemar]|nr:hypothetical protein G6F56_007696 [Rhizopus delemar]